MENQKSLSGFAILSENHKTLSAKLKNKDSFPVTTICTPEGEKFMICVERITEVSYEDLLRLSCRFKEYKEIIEKISSLKMDNLFYKTQFYLIEGYLQKEDSFLSTIGIWNTPIKIVDSIYLDKSIYSIQNFVSINTRRIGSSNGLYDKCENNKKSFLQKLFENIFIN